MKLINIIADFVHGKWERVSLFASSLGAYFSLQTYLNRKFDNLKEYECIEEFAKKFAAEVTVSEGSQHAFMEERDFPIVENWINETLKH